MPGGGRESGREGIFKSQESGLIEKRVVRRGGLEDYCRVLPDQREFPVTIEVPDLHVFSSRLWSAVLCRFVYTGSALKVPYDRSALIDTR